MHFESESPPLSCSSLKHISLHQGAVEGCCIGFTKFCASLLSSGDAELQDIPADMLKQVRDNTLSFHALKETLNCWLTGIFPLLCLSQGLQVVQSPRSTSVTRRAAGLPMLILCVLSAGEGSKAKLLLAHSIQTLLETAKTPLPERWDQTLDLPQVCRQGNKKECVCDSVCDRCDRVIVFFPFQVCAVHTLQALVRGSGLGVAVLQFAPAVAMLSLTLLSSPCWAMRNAALQLYSKTPAHSGSSLNCRTRHHRDSNCVSRFSVLADARPAAQQRGVWPGPAWHVPARLLLPLPRPAAVPSGRAKRGSAGPPGSI